MLAVHDLTSGYGKLQIVNGVSFAIEPGQIHSIVGVNGAGKTTLLRTIVGHVRASGGSIEFNGKSIVKCSAADIARAGIALVPESRDVFPGLSVRENILLGAYTRRDKADSGYAQMLELFPALERRAGQAAGSLSGGEQQMVAIARALMAEPRLLLLDEPSLGLGPMVVEAMFDVVKRLREMGTAVLLVEQNVRVALAVADFGYVLERGRIVLEGSASQLADDERVAHFYLGTLQEISQ